MQKCLEGFAQTLNCLLIVNLERLNRDSNYSELYNIANDFGQVRQSFFVDTMAQQVFWNYHAL